MLRDYPVLKLVTRLTDPIRTTAPRIDTCEILLPENLKFSSTNGEAHERKIGKLSTEKASKFQTPRIRSREEAIEIPKYRNSLIVRSRSDGVPEIRDARVQQKYPVSTMKAFAVMLLVHSRTSRNCRLHWQ